MLQLKYLVLKLLSLAFYFCLPFPFLLGKIILREREREKERGGKRERDLVREMEALRVADS